MTSRVVLLVAALFQASVALCGVGATSWDGATWPESIQQAFAEAVVWNSVTWDANEEAEALADRNSADALDRAFTLAKNESPRAYASILVAAAEGTFSTSSYRTQLRDAVTGMMSTGQATRTLEQLEPVLSGPGSEEALEIIKAMRRDAEKSEAAATDAVLRSAQVLLGGMSDQDIQWCVEAITADPTFVPAWAALAINGELEVQRYAVTQWARLEPDNGAPDVWLAEVERRSREFDEQAVGVELLESAVEKPSLSWPHFRTPTNFDVSFPNSERYREADIVGQEVSPAMLEYLRAKVNLSGTVTRALRNMYYVYLDDDSEERVDRIVSEAEQDRAARAISILSARACDACVHDVLAFMRSSTSIAASLGFDRLVDDKRRTDLTPAERQLVQARRTALDHIRASINRRKELSGGSNSDSVHDRLEALQKYNSVKSDRVTLATIRANTNFEQIVRAILAERTESTD